MSQLFVMMRPLPPGWLGDSLLPAALSLSLTVEWFVKYEPTERSISDQQALLLVCGPLTIWQTRKKGPFGSAR